MKPSLSHGRTQKFTRVAVAAACLLMCLLSQPASALFIGKLPIRKQPIHVPPLERPPPSHFPPIEVVKPLPPPIEVVKPSPLRAAKLSLETRVQQQPGDVLGQLWPGASMLAKLMAPAQQRRALVVVGHGDKISLQGLRDKVLLPADAFDIADTICAIVAEAALPTTPTPLNPSEIVERFVTQLERASDVGLMSMANGTRFWARAMQATNDPSMQATVSAIRPDRGAGIVSFHVKHPHFETDASYRVFDFATEVANTPNQPNLTRLAELLK